MTEITVKIPDPKMDFFMELINNLGFEVSQELHIPQEHKDLVSERMSRSETNPERLLNWEDVKDSFKVD